MNIKIILTLIFSILISEVLLSFLIDLVEEFPRLLQITNVDNLCGEGSNLVKLANQHEFAYSLDLSLKVFSELFIRIKVGLFGIWNTDRLILEIDGVVFSEISSSTKQHHSIKICKRDPENLDRFVVLEVPICQFEFKDSLNLKLRSTNGDFGVYDISVTTFESCPTNSRLIDKQCACNEGFFKDPTIGCISTAYSSKFCIKCSPCPAFCQSCQKNTGDVLVCNTCIEGFIILNGMCQPDGGNILSSFINFSFF